MSSSFARTAVAGPVLLWLGATLASCVIPAYDPTTHSECPCLPGYHCERARNECVPGAALTLAPIEDTYVRGGAYANDTHGDDAQLVCEGGTSLDYVRIPYLKFDLHAVATPVAKATLVLEGLYGSNTAQASTFQAFRVAGDDWTAATLTYANRPADGVGLGTCLREGDGVVELDVTSWINQELAGDMIASIGIKQTDGVDYWAFRSSRWDDAERRPVLQVILPPAADAGAAPADGGTDAETPGDAWAAD